MNIRPDQATLNALNVPAVKSVLIGRLKNYVCQEPPR